MKILYNNLLRVCKGRKTWYDENRLFPLMYDYFYFKEDILDLYCYDMTVSPEIKHDNLFLKQKPLDYYLWKIQEARYTLTERHYKEWGQQRVEDCVSEGSMDIKGQGLKYQFNVDLNTDIYKILMFFEDMRVPYFIINNREIPIPHIICPLYGLATNKLIRYECRIVNIPYLDWYKKMAILLRESIKEKVEMLPFTILGTMEYLEMYKDEGNNGEFHNELLDLFSFTVNADDFSWEQKSLYDVYTKPFIRIGDMLICPSAFLARNTWFYTFYRASMENLAKHVDFQKECSNQMEIYVEKLFKDKNPRWTVLRNYETENGDIDIYVESEDIILLIQLKRTKLRATLADAYFDCLRTDKKAAKQLNDSVVKNLENKRIVKWIVSTSYIKCMQKINGILKINYFDLIYHLRTLKYNNLREFIEFIENDGDLRNICKKFQEISNNSTAASEVLDLARNILCLPLKMVEPSVYNIPLQNDNYSDDNQFNKALELEKNGKRRTAIKILETLTCSYPDFYKYWLALANMYAEEKQYAKAFDCYEEALRIVPDDPWIIRNYAITCNEAKKFEKYSELLQILKTKYWFVDFR